MLWWLLIAVLFLFTLLSEGTTLPGPKDPIMVDWCKSDHELFCEHSDDLGDDVFEDAPCSYCADDVCESNKLLLLCFLGGYAARRD